MHKLVGVLAICFIQSMAIAQHQEKLETPATTEGKGQPIADTTSLIHAVKAGHFQGHVRSYFMTTDNHQGMSDLHAHAIGASVRFETLAWHRFRLTMSGYVIANLWSSDLSKPDSLTGQLSRYEIGLFDIENPANRINIGPFAELFLTWKARKWEAKLGRQLLNTPFINLQDGRMRPTLVEGIWINAQPARGLQVQGGWISRISPRSTTRWLSMAHSIGVYPAGVMPDGSPARFQGVLESRGVATGGLSWQARPWLSLQAWDLWMDQVFNTAMLQADARLGSSGQTTWKAAGQIIRQDGIGNGGHDEPGKAYFAPGTHALTWGLQAVATHQKWDISLNYNRITGEGRYLMPREWGRDPFFTFLSRERNEGFGDVHAGVWRLQHKPASFPLKSSLALGYFHLPDPRNTALNKYGMPSYWQANLDLRYAFGGWMKGLDTQALLVYKGLAGDTFGNPRYEFNKVNMWLVNLVVNYHF